MGSSARSGAASRAAGPTGAVTVSEQMTIADIATPFTTPLRGSVRPLPTGRARGAPAIVQW